MKIVSFTGGLGNQLFEYLFCRNLQKRFGKAKVYGYYQPSRLSLFNGLELNRWFEVELPRATRLSNIIARGYKLLEKMHLSRTVDEARYENGLEGNFFEGYWQGFRFHEGMNVKKELRFRPLQLNERNMELLDEIQRLPQTVSIHVRRGDYQNEHHKSWLGNVCTSQYYQDAIRKMEELFGNQQLVWYVFSDDVAWCRNLFGNDAHFHYVDWNTGSDSFYDLYLMSACTHHIIANSTFSYWAARLSPEEGSVVYPSTWWRGFPAPDMFPDSWIGIAT